LDPDLAPDSTRQKDNPKKETLKKFHVLKN